MKTSNPRLSVIDSRIASELHKQQIQAVIYAERAGIDLDQIIDRQVKKALGAISTASLRPPTSEEKRDAVAALAAIGPLAADNFADNAFRLAAWSHAQTVRMVARTLPRAWFRHKVPEIIYYGEAIQRDPAIVGPVLPSGQRLSDTEWENLLKQVMFPSPTQDQVENWLNQDLYGQSTTSRLRELSKLIDDPAKVIDDLATGLATGENLQQLSKKLESRVQGVKASARRIARTEGLRACELSNRQAYDGLGDMLLGMQAVASLDENTRPHHALRNGTIYYYDPARKPHIKEMPLFPDEPNCRCFSSPVMRPPAEFESDPALRAAFSNSQGQTIPDPSVYSQWFENASPTAKKIAVGNRRYKEVEKALDGKRAPEWTDFIDKDGKLVPSQTLAGRVRRSGPRGNRRSTTSSANVKTWSIRCVCGVLWWSRLNQQSSTLAKWRSNTPRTKNRSRRKSNRRV